eukprot:TRINITY_DN9401_c0_g1_i3.p1 TRINITY_DN9401_c0_g1~~TRINITY_DN9401_c0_g1_i3.p1  ORF type:complete len:288 (+),score=22.81 TRINITY_DN9401_c0_g1_i3:37-864(+)
MACLPAAACFAGVGSCKSPRRSAEHAPKLVSNEKERIEGRLRSKSEDFIFGETCDRSSSPSDDGRHIVESPICPEKSKSLTFSPKSPALRDRIPYADLHLSLSFNIRTSDEAETVIEDYQESEGSQYSQYHSMTPQSSYWLGTMTPQSSQLGGSVTPASSYWGDESWYDQNTDNVDYAEPEESVISEHHCSAGVVGARKVRGQGVFFIVEVAHYYAHLDGFPAFEVVFLSDDGRWGVVRRGSRLVRFFKVYGGRRGQKRASRVFAEGDESNGHHL